MISKKYVFRGKGHRKHQPAWAMPTGDPILVVGIIEMGVLNHADLAGAAAPRPQLRRGRQYRSRLGDKPPNSGYSTSSCFPNCASSRCAVCPPGTARLNAVRRVVRTPNPCHTSAHAVYPSRAHSCQLTKGGVCRVQPVGISTCGSFVSFW
jgi:hypothetical protein